MRKIVGRIRARDRRHHFAPSVLLISLLGCQSSIQATPAALQGPPATFADFREQVLDPLAGKLADEQIHEAQVQARLEFAKRERQRVEGKASSEGIAFLSGAAALVVAPPYSTVAGILGFLAKNDANKQLTASQKDEAAVNEFIALTVAQRGPRKRSTLDNLDKITDRTKENDAMFSLCADQVLRKYEWNGARFALLSADPC